MSLQVIPNSNIVPPKAVINQSSNGVSNGSAFKVYDKQKEASAKVKIGVALTTVAGVATAMAIALKGVKGRSSNFFKSLFFAKYTEEELPKFVTKLAVGSVGGGLIGGAIFDKKENMNAKYREAIIQMIGNIFTPLLCVAGGMKLFENFALPKIMEKFALKTDGIPKLIASAACLLTGIVSGNKIGNFINKKAFRVDDERKLKLSDMSPHIDDTCLALALVAPKNNNVVGKVSMINVIGDAITRFIPVALTLSGFSTGVAQECSHHINNDKTNKISESKSQSQ